jgi:S-methylmethionine-dependent homocysteine/selenocysteine methylase
MNKLIATGTVLEENEVKIVASVYVDLMEDGSESTEVGAHYVTLSYANGNAEAQPMDAMTFADIAAAAGAKEESGAEEESAAGLVVPGFEGHADVELAAPFAVKYSKTKAFMRVDGTVQVNAAMRYVF